MNRLIEHLQENFPEKVILQDVFVASKVKEKEYLNNRLFAHIYDWKKTQTYQIGVSVYANYKLKLLESKNNLTSISFLFVSYKSSFVAIPFKTISICWPASNTGCVSSSHLSLKMPASTDLNENGILTVFPGRTTPKKTCKNGYTPQMKLLVEVFQCKVRLSNEIQTFWKKLLFHQFFAWQIHHHKLWHFYWPLKNL